ncbi:biopolymer transporter ExbD [Spirosoma arcticum]
MKIRPTYRPIRIDMAPFVSIALLLIVFFIWVKLVQRPTVMSGNMVRGCRKGIEPDRSKKVLDILLLDKNEMQFSHHSVGSVCCANFVTDNANRSHKLRQALLRYREEALIPGELAIVIHPMPESTFGNFVDVLDELRICGNLPYLIDFWVYTRKSTPGPATASASRR